MSILIYRCSMCSGAAGDAAARESADQRPRPRPHSRPRRRRPDEGAAGDAALPHRRRHAGVDAQVAHPRRPQPEAVAPQGHAPQGHAPLGRGPALAASSRSQPIVARRLLNDTVLLFFMFRVCVCVCVCVREFHFMSRHRNEKSTQSKCVSSEGRVRCIQLMFPPPDGAGGASFTSGASH